MATIVVVVRFCMLILACVNTANVVAARGSERVFPRDWYTLCVFLCSWIVFVLLGHS